MGRQRLGHEAVPTRPAAPQVLVKTSDIRGAGTDANVTLAMFGQLEGQATNSGTHKLDNSASKCGQGPNLPQRNAVPAPHLGRPPALFPWVKNLSAHVFRLAPPFS